MGLRIHSASGVLEKNVSKAREEVEDSLEKLSSGLIFSKKNPRPAEQAISNALDSRVKEMQSRKTGISNAKSIVEIADSALDQIQNMVVRMDEIKVRALSSTISDTERQLSLLEYNELYKEIGRVAQETSLNGFYPLNPSAGRSGVTEINVELGPISDHANSDAVAASTLTIQTADFSDPSNLGLVDVSYQVPGDVQNVDGLEVSDIEDLFSKSWFDAADDGFETAFNKIMALRTHYGACSVRLEEASTYNEVYQENLEAANSRIRDVDYAAEVARFTSAKIKEEIGVSVLAQANKGDELVGAFVQYMMRRD